MFSVGALHHYHCCLKFWFLAIWFWLSNHSLKDFDGQWWPLSVFPPCLPYGLLHSSHSLGLYGYDRPWTILCSIENTSVVLKGFKITVQIVYIFLYLFTCAYVPKCLRDQYWNPVPAPFGFKCQKFKKSFILISELFLLSHDCHPSQSPKYYEAFIATLCGFFLCFFSCSSSP